MTKDDRRPPEIAVFAGPTATILNTPPLVTSQKARRTQDLPLTSDWTDLPDALYPQRLAAPATVYVEQFSAHPLERDAVHLYAPPDGYVDRTGSFRRQRKHDDDIPVYEVHLDPADGLYPLPFVGRKADGTAWEEDCSVPDGADAECRQPFFPDASRLFEEIDRLGLDAEGRAGQLRRHATFSFHRAAPSGGYIGKGERRGIDYFPYRPRHLRALPGAQLLAEITNQMQRTLEESGCRGAIWLEGSPHLEESLYWLGLLLDTTLPLVGLAAHRLHRSTSADGERNVGDAVTYLVSDACHDQTGRDTVGPVLIADQLIFTARDVYKADARPGGFRAGGGGGPIGSIDGDGLVSLGFRPTRLSTHRSHLNLRNLPSAVGGPARRAGATAPAVVVRDADGYLAVDAMPTVTFVKHGRYLGESRDPNEPVEILARLARQQAAGSLSGFVAEGTAPYGTMGGDMDTALATAAYSGFPVVKVGRGVPEGFVPLGRGPFVAGSNLTATKARLLLMAAILKLGMLPAADNASNPTKAERTRLRAGLEAYQELFDTH
jgi:hypothetical protein